MAKKIISIAIKITNTFVRKIKTPQNPIKKSKNVKIKKKFKFTNNIE